MKTLSELLSEVQELLNKINAHPDFVALVGLEEWEDPAIYLEDAKTALQGVLNIYEASQNG